MGKKESNPAPSRFKEKEVSMIKLGDEVKDSITGFKGIAVARTVYLNGCISILICAKKLNSDNKEVELWFDEQRVDSKSKAEVGDPQTRPPKLHP